MYFRTQTSSLIVQNNYLNQEEADTLYQSIITDKDSLYPLEVYPKGFAYGKEITFHRSIGFFSDTSKGYKFSKQTTKSHPLTTELKHLINKINQEFETSFNGVLINIYRSGCDYISAHSDDEKELDKSKHVIAISLGSSRCFRIRTKQHDTEIDTSLLSNKKCKTPVFDIQTEHGQLIAMCGNFQSEFTHEIPIEKTKPNTPRISLTFRCHSH